MEKEEILAAAVKAENKCEEYEGKVISRGSIYGSVASVILGFVLCLFELLVTGRLDMGIIAVGLIGSAVQFFYEGIKIKKKLFIIIGVFQSMVTLIAVLGFMITVVLL